jgi:hypothetical protein
MRAKLSNCGCHLLVICLSHCQIGKCIGALSPRLPSSLVNNASKDLSQSAGEKELVTRRDVSHDGLTVQVNVPSGHHCFVALITIDV